MDAKPKEMTLMMERHATPSEVEEADRLITVTQVTKRYGTREVVKDLSFTVRRGEILGMLGPNGAGKTTTLRMLVGLVKPTKGDIRLQGYSIRENRAAALLNVGAVMEESRFYPYLTGRDNLTQVARMRSLSAPESETERLLAKVGLAEVADRPVREYSLGMRQRLALAVALMVQPAILILDEPMNGLDPAAIKDMRDRLRELAAGGVAMVLSSHLLAEVEQLCDRVILINQGRVIGEEAVHGDALRALPVSIAVGDRERAEAVLREAQLPYDVSGETFAVSIPTTAVPDLVKRLVLADIPVLSVVPGRATLESRYLEITGQSGEAVS
jgi:ABC-2 type transport system ATP-binding protein